MIELANARRRLELMVGLLERHANDVAYQLNYVVDLTASEAHGLSMLHERMVKALTILKEVI